MAQLDKTLSAVMNDLHAKQVGFLNRAVVEKVGFQVGDRVWVLRPKLMGDTK